MKDKLKLSTLALLSILLLVLTACGGHREPDPEPLHLSLVLGAHSNSPRPTLALVEEDIYHAVTSRGSLTVVNCDGAPYLVDSVIIRPPKKKVTQAKQDSLDTKNTNALLTIARSTVAQTPEVDTLAALHLAARNLNDLSGEKQIIVMDSGLSTTGLLDFTSSTLEADPQEIAAYLAQNSALPDLSGISVRWTGLGDVMAPQDALTYKARENLTAIWKAILEASNASYVDILSASSGLNSYSEEAPYVTPVSIPKAEPISFTKPIIFTEKELYFHPGSAQLRDPASAKQVLSPIVQYMAEHPDFCLLLAGTTAQAGSQEECVELSLRRAETVRTLLLESGVSAAQLHDEALGLGWDHSYHIPDRKDGQLDEEIAPLNRSVILQDASSEEAKALIAQFN